MDMECSRRKVVEEYKSARYMIKINKKKIKTNYSIRFNKINCNMYTYCARC